MDEKKEEVKARTMEYFILVRFGGLQEVFNLPYENNYVSVGDEVTDTDAESRTHSGRFRFQLSPGAVNFCAWQYPVPTDGDTEKAFLTCIQFVVTSGGIPERKRKKWEEPLPR